MLAPKVATQADDRKPSPRSDLRYMSWSIIHVSWLHSCLQVILPELWDAAVELFDASRAGVVSDRKRTQKVQEKVRVWVRFGAKEGWRRSICAISHS